MGQKETFKIDLLIMFISLLLFTSCSPKEESIIDIEKDIGNDVIVGEVAPFSTSAITPKVAGELVSLEVKKGDFVEKGQVLGSIDDQDLKEQLDLEKKTLEKLQLQKLNAEIHVKQLEIEVEKAEKKVEQSKLLYDDLNQINGAKIDKSKLAIQLEDAKRIKNKMEVLYKNGAISELEYLQALSSEQNAMLAYQQAELTENKLKIDVDIAELSVEGQKEELQKALIAVQDVIATIEQTQLKIKQLENKLNNTQIKAIQSGEIFEIHYDIGETISTQQTLFEVATLDPVLVEVELTPEQLPLINNNETLEIEIPALNKKVKGTVTYISSIANESDLYLVELVIENNNGEIKPGMPANVIISS